MTRRFQMVAAVACAAAILTLGPVVTSSQAAPTEREISRLIARENFIKEQFEQLKTKMLELADLFDKTSIRPDVPEAERQRQAESAKTLRQAVAQAQKAMIAQGMEAAHDRRFIPRRRRHEGTRRQR